jgi:hypothetical protein
MTDNEFLELYEALYRDLLNSYIELIKSNSSLKYQTLFNKTVEFDAEISRKSNLLVFQIIKEKGLEKHKDIEFKASELYRKAFNIILDCNQYYQSILDSILLEVKSRDLNE